MAIYKQKTMTNGLIELIRTKCEVVGETAKSYKIKLLEHGAFNGQTQGREIWVQKKSVVIK